MLITTTPNDGEVIRENADNRSRGALSAPCSAAVVDLATIYLLVGKETTWGDVGGDNSDVGLVRRDGLRYACRHPGR
jgi:hypothetical protein